jgi:hypothetical protein
MPVSLRSTRLVLSMVDDRFIISTGLRGKVERLLRGDVRSTDLHELFFNMRAESGGSGLVSEIANFIAHPDARTKGITWQDTRDVFAILKLRLDVSPIITRDMPASAHGTLRANLRRMRKSTLKDQLGMSRSQAAAILETILRRSIPTAPGRVSKLTFQNQQEFDVASCIASHIKGGSLFSDSDLFEDFYRALKRQGHIQSSEKKALKNSKAGISLFALTAMHNRAIDLGDGSFANMAISADMRGNLGAFAFSEVEKDYGQGNMIGAVWIFETDLSTQTYCEPGVAPLGRTKFIGDFEITPQIRLSRS